MDVIAKVNAFRKTISTNLLAGDDFIDWDAVDRRISAISTSAESLQRFVDCGDLSIDAITEELRSHPAVYGLLLDLVAFNSTGAQVEKWGLPQVIDPKSSRVQWVAGQLHYIGLPKILQGKPSVVSLLRVAEIYKDSFRRRFRSGRKLEDRVRKLVFSALLHANQTLPESVSINPNALPDAQLRRSLNYVLTVGNRPVAGIATVFQNQSGGRQQRDLSITYPNLQERLQSVGLSLILVADGQGLREASDRTLSSMFEGVRYPLTLQEAADGKLAQAIIESATIEAPETFDQTALNQIIQQKLRTNLTVKYDELPVSPDHARLALAYYVNSRRRTSIELSSGGGAVSWAHKDWVQRARQLKISFKSEDALLLFCEMLGLQIKQQAEKDGTVFADASAPAVQPFAHSLHVSAFSVPLNAELARDIGHRSMEQAPGSPVAVYLTVQPLNEQQIQAHRKEQIFLPVNVVVVSATLLEQMAMNRRPITPFLDAILAQSDLTKVSPFILNNATPARMFYGRESEAATILSTIATNSVAILGSRRIGKTSLIRRVQSELAAAKFQPFFGDCQVVRTWEDFGDLARRNWEVALPDNFRPKHLSELVSQLQQKGDGQVVIILDEIDQLLDWDQTHDTESVPEAFFRACRSISQEGSAQFVFSGERRIAKRLWDPQSPHWNFCRELQLRQLNLSDATALLMEPLIALNIEIDDRPNFESEAWKHTSGHPQIVQYLGDRLVRELDERADRQKLVLTPADIRKITQTFEYAEHYLSTYWGQASPTEKAISELIAESETSSADLLVIAKHRQVAEDQEELFTALRMLQLYGIVTEVDGVLRLRAEWFPQALARFKA